MFNEALGGNMPELPGLVLPAELGGDRLLEIYKEILDLKLEKMRSLSSATGGKRFSPEELRQVAALISHAAESDTFAAHQKLLGKDGEIFHSAMARHSKIDVFNIHKLKLDAQHRKDLVNAFQGDVEQD